MTEYYSPKGALDDLSNTYNDYTKVTQDMQGVEKIYGQMNLLGEEADKRGGIIRGYDEMNRKANSPGARMQKKLAALNPFQQLFQNHNAVDSRSALAQASAWDWNNRADAARNNVYNQIAEDTSEYSQGNRNNNMMGSGLEMGMFYDYDPYSGIQYTQG
jgi:hypothetical protein